MRIAAKRERRSSAVRCGPSFVKRPASAELDRPAVDTADPSNPAPHALHATAAGEAASPTRSHWALQGLFWIALIAFAKAAQAVLAPLVVAMALAFALSPAVQALRRRGLHEAWAAAIVVGLPMVVVGALAEALAAPAAQWWERAPAMLAQLVGQIAPDALKERLASEGVALTGTFLERTLSAGVSTAATVILLYFMLVSEHWVVARAVDIFPRRRTRAVALLQLGRARRDIGRFIGTLGLIYAVVGALTTACMAALGLPNPLLWGVIAAVLNFIPYIGPVVIAILLLLAALATFGPVVAALAPPAVFVLIHALESNFVSPWFMGQRLVLSPLSIFLSVLFWGWMWGMTGAFVAVPILLGLRNFCKGGRRWRPLCLLLEGPHGRGHRPTARAWITRQRRG
jgi:predicted PurR-regulated permease PerM